MASDINDAPFTGFGNRADRAGELRADILSQTNASYQTQQANRASAWAAQVQAQDRQAQGTLHPAPSVTTDAAERKAAPMARGLLDYFPEALMAVAACSKKGNDQHNPGQEMHWAREKSTDHADCIMRHLIERNAVDTDGILHAAKVAWRALALLQTVIEARR